jgi:hypothetical protein
MAAIIELEDRAIYARETGHLIAEYRKRHSLTETALAHSLYLCAGDEWPLTLSQFLWTIRRLQRAAAGLHLTRLFLIARSLAEEPVAVFEILLSRVDEHRLREMAPAAAQLEEASNG